MLYSMIFRCNSVISFQQKKKATKVMIYIISNLENQKLKKTKYFLESF